jgi:hypothetical protein
MDHVVPQQMIKVGYPREWVLDTLELGACCSTIP